MQTLFTKMLISLGCVTVKFSRNPLGLAAGILFQNTVFVILHLVAKQVSLVGATHMVLLIHLATSQFFHPVPMRGRGNGVIF